MRAKSSRGMMGTSMGRSMNGGIVKNEEFVLEEIVDDRCSSGESRERIVRGV
jgi:hypothetical protein